jgi:hypothetical protein
MRSQLTPPTTGRAPVQPRERLGQRQGGGHVATTADPDQERAARGGEQGVGVEHRAIVTADAARLRCAGRPARFPGRPLNLLRRY